jgi:capsular polysaccharide biosynthesis protein
MCQPDSVPKELSVAAAEWRDAKQAVEDSKAQMKASRDRVRAARADLAESLVAEAKRGTRMRELVDSTGLSREWIRIVLRQNGIFPED